jgi:ABC-2 type transport system permease protein
VSAHATLGRKATAVGDMRRLETALRQTSLAQRLEHANLSSALVDSLTRSRLVLESERLTEQGRGTDASRRANAPFAIAVAFLLYTSMILYGQAVLRGVLEEKSTRVAEVVVSSVSPETLLAGKVIGVGAVGLTQQIIWVVATLYLGSFTAPILMRMAPSYRRRRVTDRLRGVPAMTMSMPDVHIGVCSSSCCSSSSATASTRRCYAAVGSTVNSEQEAQQALAPILVLIVSSALFIQPAMLNPTSTLARVASMFPFSAPIIMPAQDVARTDTALGDGGRDPRAHHRVRRRDPARGADLQSRAPHVTASVRRSASSRVGCDSRDAAHSQRPVVTGERSDRVLAVADELEVLGDGTNRKRHDT